MNVFSAFDGISCGQQALDRLGIKVDNYFASEIDKYAIKITQKNYPDTIQLGDVRDVKGSDLPDIDLILCGSPCQGFSFAGNQLAFDDPRSALFFEFIRILKECKPKYFLLENVRMKQEYIDVITDEVSFLYPTEGSYVQATFFDFAHRGMKQKRKKIVPVLINSSLVSAQNRQRLYWTNIPNVTQPEDRGLILRDVLEDGFDSERDKSYCLDANYYKGTNVRGYFKKKRRQLVVKAMTERRTEEAKRIRKEHMKKTGKDWSPRRGKELVPRTDNKANCLTTSMTKEHILEIIEDKELYWRKLTPLECERLQTVEDNYTEGVSNTQRYKMLGNSFTVEIISHILNVLAKDNK